MPDDKDFELDDLDSFSFDELDLEGDSQAPDSQDGEDKYGVWVKGEPEDVKDELEPSLLDDDLPAAPAAEEPPLAEDDFLSSEELAKLDDQFDFVTVSEEPLEGETLDTDDEISPNLDPDEPQTLTLDDFEQEEVFEEPVSARSSAPASSRSPEPADELPQNSFDEISLDDFVSFDDEDAPAPEVPAPLDDSSSQLASEDELAEEFLDIDIEIEDEIDDEELEILEGAQVVREETQSFEQVDGAEEIDLAEFADFTDETPEVAAQEPELADSLDLDLDSLETESAVQSFEEVEPFENPDLSPEDLTIADIEIPSVEEMHEINLEPQDEMDMDHILALEEDLTSGIRQDNDGILEAGSDSLDSLDESLPEPEESFFLEEEEPVLAEAAPAPSAPPARPSAPAQEPAPREESASAVKDLAAQILSKIESELSSIKQEITELKKEVTTLRVVPAKEEEPSDDKKPHGFFDEEDDETIALTGDELDNILSTAEISEGEEIGETLDDDFTEPASGSGDLISTDLEGNIVDEPQHVTDEEFLAGTSLELDDHVDAQLPPEQDSMPFPGGAEEELGIPSSIELEESLPDSLDDQDTENLLPSDNFDLSEDDLSLAPAEIETESPELDIPFDDEVSLDDELPVPESALSNSDDDFLTTGVEPYIETPVHEELDEVILEDRDEPAPAPAEADLSVPPPVSRPQGGSPGLSPSMREELKAVLSYMDRLLASLPDEKIQEFAESEHFEVYKHLFEELGLIE